MLTATFYNADADEEILVGELRLDHPVEVGDIVCSLPGHVGDVWVVKRRQWVLGDPNMVIASEPYMHLDVLMEPSFGIFKPGAEAQTTFIGPTT